MFAVSWKSKILCLGLGMLETWMKGSKGPKLDMLLGMSSNPRGIWRSTKTFLGTTGNKKESLISSDPSLTEASDNFTFTTCDVSPHFDSWGGENVSAQGQSIKAPA